jgi:hypothetical protein
VRLCPIGICKTIKSENLFVSPHQSRFSLLTGDEKDGIITVELTRKGVGYYGFDQRSGFSKRTQRKSPRAQRKAQSSGKTIGQKGLQNEKDSQKFQS